MPPDEFDEIESRFGGAKAAEAPSSDDFDAIEAQFADDFDALEQKFGESAPPDLRPVPDDPDPLDVVGTLDAKRRALEAAEPSRTKFSDIQGIAGTDEGAIAREYEGRKGRPYRQAIDYATRIDGMTPTAAMEAFGRNPDEQPEKVDRYLRAKAEQFGRIARAEPGATRATRSIESFLGPFSPTNLRESLVGGRESQGEAISKEVEAFQRDEDGFWANLLTEGVPGAAGAAGRMIAGANVAGTLPAAFIEGAAGAPEGERFKGGVKMAGLVGLGGAGTRGLAPAGSGALRTAGAATVAGTGAEVAVKALAGEPITAQGLAESALLNLGMAGPDILASRRAGGRPPADAPDLPPSLAAEPAPPPAEAPPVAPERPPADHAPTDSLPPSLRPPAAPDAPLDAPPVEPARAAPEAPAPVAEAPDMAVPPSMRGEATGIKNAVVNAERAERGVAPLEGAPVEHHPEVVTRARASIVDNPNRASELVREVAEKPRNLSTEEEAVLDIHRVDTKRAFERADREGREAAARGDTDGVAEALARRTEAHEDWMAMDEASKAAGREWGRSGSFRKRLMADDYSLVKMESDVRAAQDFKPLTAEQQAEVRALHDRVAQADARVAKVEEQLAAVSAKRALGKVAERVRTTKYGATNKGVTLSAYEAAKARLRAKGLQLNSGFDLTMIADAAQMGAFHLEAGARGFARWSKKMAKEFGEQIRPHLRAVYAEALKQAPAMKDETGLAEAGKIAELVMREGVKGREAVLTEVHNILKETNPEVTRRQVNDAIAGYGKVRPLNQDPIKVELRELKGQMQQLAKLDDMAQGRAPLKSGPERQAPGDEQRRLIKEVNEAKRVGGYDVRDPAAELRSTQDAIKTRLKNDIADLDRQIAAGKRDIPDRTKVTLDADATALKARRDALKKVLDALDPAGVKARTDEQRIEAAVRATEKSIAEYERKIGAGDIGTRKAAPGPTNPALDALRARRDALKAQLDDFRSAALKQTPLPHEVEAKRIKAAEKAIDRATAEYERRVRENDLEPKRKVDEAFEARKEKMLTAARARGDMAKAKWRDKLVQQRLANQTLATKAVRAALVDAPALLRVLKTTGDFSLAGIQGGLRFAAALTSPKRMAGFGRSLREGFKAFHSAEGQARAESRIKNDPGYESARQSKTKFGGHGTTKVEEALRSDWGDKIPVLRAFQRFGQTYMNRLRLESHKVGEAVMSRSGKMTPGEKAVLSNFVNITTGRGNLGGKFEGALDAMNHAFFAPRWTISRFQVLLSPFSGFRFGKGATARTRKYIATEYARSLIGISLVMGLAKGAGADIDLDPDSNTFGMIKIGDTTIDLFVGVLQAATFLRRSGVAIVEGDPKERDQSRTFVGDYVRGKLAPLPGAFVSRAYGKTLGYDEKGKRKDATWGELGKDVTVPIAIGDIKAALEEHGPIAGSALGALSIFGLRIRTYDRDRRKKGGK